jgi:hypothetical protein
LLAMSRKPPPNLSEIRKIDLQVLLRDSLKDKISLPTAFSRIDDGPGDSNAVVFGCNPKRE